MNAKIFLDKFPMKIKKYRQVSGGDVNQCFCIETENEKFFLKVNEVDKYPNMYVYESNNLESIRNTNTVNIPKIKETGMIDNVQYLLMNWIEKGSGSEQIWRDFGRGLAEMHKKPQYKFGWKEDNYIGRLNQNNTECDTWKEFYSEYRIMPFIKRLIDGGSLASNRLKRAENFCNQINEIFPIEKPSLLHGDLWTGNFIISQDESVYLIDPSSYCGHREIDLAMLQLFGDIPIEFFWAYNEVYPLEQGWEERRIYAQVYPLLVHAILFEGYYVEQLNDILKKFKKEKN